MHVPHRCENTCFLACFFTESVCGLPPRSMFNDCDVMVRHRAPPRAPEICNWTFVHRPSRHLGAHQSCSLASVRLSLHAPRRIACCRSARTPFLFGCGADAYFVRTTRNYPPCELILFFCSTNPTKEAAVTIKKKMYSAKAGSQDTAAVVRGKNNLHAGNIPGHYPERGPSQSLSRDS